MQFVFLNKQYLSFIENDMIFLQKSCNQNHWITQFVLLLHFACSSIRFSCVLCKRCSSPICCTCVFLVRGMQQNDLWHVRALCMLIKYFTPYDATLLLMKTHATTTPTLSPQHTTQNGSWNRNWWKLAKFQMKAKYNLPIPFVIWI